MNRCFLFAISLCFPILSFASPPAALTRHEATQEQDQKISKVHQYLNQQGFGRGILDSNQGLRPYADYEHAAYVFMSADIRFDSDAAKYEVAKNLPPDVTLVLYTGLNDGPTPQSTLDTYSKFLPASRIKILMLKSFGDALWARDGLPIPLVDQNNKLNLVDAKYYHAFEPDKDVAEHFNAPLTSHPYYFEGGNFMANRLGECFIVNNQRVKDVPDQIFSDYYHCKELTRFPQISGIGHIDEHARFLDDTTVITDLPEYEKVFAQHGYKTFMLPQPNRPYETYANSLTVNGTVFVPIYSEANDEKALDVYRSTGLKVVPLRAKALSVNGHGNVHCITMTYPDVPLTLEGL